MVLIGIITDLKSENNIKKLLCNNKLLCKNNVIFIKETNIDNIKNVHFDTVIINEAFTKIDKLNKLLKHTKNIIINMDAELKSDNLNIVNSNIITYGFNSKSSITISSVTDDDVLICVQRKIYTNFGEIDQQEIRLENNENYSIYDLIMVLTLFLLYFSTVEKININGIK